MQDNYTVNEDSGYVEVCVFIAGNVEASGNVTLQIQTFDDFGVNGARSECITDSTC